MSDVCRNLKKLILYILHKLTGTQLRQLRYTERYKKL